MSYASRHVPQYRPVNPLSLMVLALAALLALALVLMVANFLLDWRDNAARFTVYADESVAREFTVERTLN